MGELANKFLKDITGVAIFEFLKSAALGLFSLLGGVVGIHNLVESLPSLTPYKFLLWLLAGVISLLIGVFAYERMTRNLPRFDRVNSDVRVLQKIISYDYRDPNNIIYRRQYRFKILRKGVDRFVDRYRWSGNSEPKMESAKAGQTIHPLSEERLFRFFEIRFDRPYNKKAILEADIIWKLADTSGASHPVISATIHELTDELVMQVTLPPSNEIPKALHTFAPDIGAKINVETWEAPFTNNNVEIWTIKTPRLLHYYEVRWKKPN